MKISTPELIFRILFYVAILILVLFCAWVSRGEAQEPVLFTAPTNTPPPPARQTPPVAPTPTPGLPITPTSTGIPLPAIQPTLSVSCIPRILTWDCTAIVYFNESDIPHTLAVDAEPLFSWHQIRMPDAWGVELRYYAPAPCSGELSRIRLLAVLGEETVELDRHTVTARCNLLPLVIK